VYNPVVKNDDILLRVNM